MCVRLSGFKFLSELWDVEIDPPKKYGTEDAYRIFPGRNVTKGMICCSEIKEALFTSKEINPMCGFSDAAAAFH